MPRRNLLLMKKGWRVEVTWRNFTTKSPGSRGAHFQQWSWSFPTWAYCKASYTGLLKETAVSWPFTSSEWSHSETAWPSSTADSSTQFGSVFIDSKAAGFWQDSTEKPSSTTVILSCWERWSSKGSHFKAWAVFPSCFLHVVKSYLWL